MLLLLAKAALNGRPSSTFDPLGGDDGSDGNGIAAADAEE
jgi:hypothetical protein